MGCSQSKATQTKDNERVDQAELGAKHNESEDASNKNEYGEEGCEGQADIPPTPVVRKELDVRPPPVKAIPKITPKAIPKK